MKEWTGRITQTAHHLQKKLSLQLLNSEMAPKKRKVDSDTINYGKNYLEF